MTLPVRDWSELPPGKHEPAEVRPGKTACALVQRSYRASLVPAPSPTIAGWRPVGCARALMPIVGASRALRTLDFASREPNACSQTRWLRCASAATSAPHCTMRAWPGRPAKDSDQAGAYQEHLAMVDKVRAVGQLASGVAHDFSNLLAGILGNAQLLLLDPPGDDQRDMLG
ncbi:MAG: hypothetical protein U0Z44_03550 [Kouleothrix sp.]